MQSEHTEGRPPNPPKLSKGALPHLQPPEVQNSRRNAAHTFWGGGREIKHSHFSKPLDTGFLNLRLTNN